jgi:hypothetical protein
MEITRRIKDASQLDGKRKRRKKGKWKVPHRRISRMEVEGSDVPGGWNGVVKLTGLRRVTRYNSSRMEALVLQLVGVACRQGSNNLRRRAVRLEKAKQKKIEWLEYSSRMEWTGGVEDMRRRNRLEKAEARKRESWTYNFAMDWMENDSKAEIAHSQDITDMEC